MQHGRSWGTLTPNPTRPDAPAPSGRRRKDPWHDFPALASPSRHAATPSPAVSRHSCGRRGCDMLVAEGLQGHQARAKYAVYAQPTPGRLALSRAAHYHLHPPPWGQLPEPPNEGFGGPQRLRAGWFPRQPACSRPVGQAIWASIKQRERAGRREEDDGLLGVLGGLLAFSSLLSSLARLVSYLPRVMSPAV